MSEARSYRRVRDRACDLAEQSDDGNTSSVPSSRERDFHLRWPRRTQIAELLNEASSRDRFA